MKLCSQIILVIAILNLGCRSDEKKINQFSHSIDTLVIRTEKQKGDGLFLLGASPLDFKDVANEFPYAVILPKNITE